MKQLKIFDAVEEVMKMDDLQLLQARKHFNWAYLRRSLEELDNFICDGRPSDVCPECGEPYSGACGPCSIGHCQG